MADQSNQSVQPDSSALTDLKKEIDKLSAENLVLRTRKEFEDAFRSHQEKLAQDFKDHKGVVDGEINKRLIGMSLLALLVAAFGWWSAILPVRKLVTARLDKEFATKRIQTTISDAAQRAAQIQTKQLMENVIGPATATALADIKQKQAEV